MSRIRIPTDQIICCVAGWLTVIAVAFSAPVGVRLVLTLGFAGICPGWVLLSGMTMHERLERFVYAIGLSLAIDTVVAEGLAIIHQFTALIALALLSALVTARCGLTAIG